MSGPTKEDIEIFGEDLVDFAQRAAAPIVDQRVGHLERQLGEVRTTLAQERVQAALDRDPELGAKWRELNEDPKFLGWLREIDPLTGEPRQTLLTRAYRAGDAMRCRHFFDSYLAEEYHPEHQRTAERRPFETTAPQPRASYADLNDRRKVWRRAEIAAFYRDRQKGRFSGREQEAGRIEAEILAAAKAGRVEPDRLRMPGEK